MSAQEARSEVNVRSNIGQNIRTGGRITSNSAAKRPKKQGVDAIPLKNPQHKFVIFNEGHKNKKIISSEAVFRIVRLVSCNEEANAVVKKHSQYNQIPFLLHATHSWKLMSSISYTTEEELERISTIYNDRLKLIAEKKKTFDAYCTEKKDMASKPNDDPRHIDFRQREIDAIKAEKKHSTITSTPDTASSDSNIPLRMIHEDVCVLQRFAVTVTLYDSNNCKSL